MFSNGKRKRIWCTNSEETSLRRKHRQGGRYSVEVCKNYPPNATIFLMKWETKFSSE